MVASTALRDDAGGTSQERSTAAETSPRPGNPAVWIRIARTFKMDAQQRISLMELMTRIRIGGNRTR